jgi:hypothetical protein
MRNSKNGEGGETGLAFGFHLSVWTHMTAPLLDVPV